MYPPIITGHKRAGSMYEPVAPAVPGNQHRQQPHFGGSFGRCVLRCDAAAGATHHGAEDWWEDAGPTETWRDPTEAPLRTSRPRDTATPSQRKRALSHVAATTMRDTASSHGSKPDAVAGHQQFPNPEIQLPMRSRFSCVTDSKRPVVGSDHRHSQASDNFRTPIVADKSKRRIRAPCRTLSGTTKYCRYNKSLTSPSPLPLPHLPGGSQRSAFILESQKLERTINDDDQVWTRYQNTRRLLLGFAFFRKTNRTPHRNPPTPSMKHTNAPVSHVTQPRNRIAVEISTN
ncbi:hypothetical protein VTI74DRAFT_6402 [Chaetomium olivicolor]